jgi:drug/metabolite transporter (DMT)-like permease
MLSLFRFQTTTWLLLAVVFAWVVVERPWFTWHEKTVELSKTSHDPYHTVTYTTIKVPQPNPRLLGPLLAMTALICWKIGTVLIPYLRQR